MVKFIKKVKRKLFSILNEKRQFPQRVKFYSQFISQGDLCFDIGANMGNRTKPFLELKARIIAVEPQKKCCKYLKRKFGNKIIIIPKGVGEKEEKKIFYISDSSVLSSFSEEWIDSMSESKRFGPHHWEKSESVEMTTLDVLIKQYGIPKFIKIDVEGYELQVLKGLSHSINFISFEYAVPENTAEVIKCIEQIEIINRGTFFNYSIGESMELFLSDWLSAEQMIERINSIEFEATRFGDIYAKKI